MTVNDPRLELVYSESLRSITEQQQVLTELRGRASLLLSAAALVTSFLGAAALQRHGIRGWSAAGVTCLSTITALVIFMLWPRKWQFRFSADVLLGHYIDGDNPAADINELRRDLTARNDENYTFNEKSLRRLQWAFEVGCGMLLLEVVFWVLAIGWKATP